MTRERYYTAQFFDPSIASAGEVGREEPGIRIYPNPAHDVVRIQNPEFKIQSSVQLIDLQGRVVREETLNSEFVILNLTSLPAGLYFVRSGGQVQKLVVQ